MQSAKCKYQNAGSPTDCHSVRFSGGAATAQQGISPLREARACLRRQASSFPPTDEIPRCSAPRNDRLAKATILHACSTEGPDKECLCMLGGLGVLGGSIPDSGSPEFLDSSHTFPSIPNVETMRCVSPCGHRLADLHRTRSVIAITPTRGGRPARELKGLGLQTGIPWAVAEFSSASPNYRE